jgi:hypothetical protein
MGSHRVGETGKKVMLVLALMSCEDEFVLSLSQNINASAPAVN